MIEFKVLNGEVVIKADQHKWLRRYLLQLVMTFKVQKSRWSDLVAVRGGLKRLYIYLRDFSFISVCWEEFLREILYTSSKMNNFVADNASSFSDVMNVLEIY